MHPFNNMFICMGRFDIQYIGYKQITKIPVSKIGDRNCFQNARALCLKVILNIQV